MSWFESIISNLINSLATGLQNALGLSMYQVIKNNLMSHQSTFGAGHWTDLVSSANDWTFLVPFYRSFYAIGAAFFLIAVYIWGMSISGAGNSTTQRQRLKSGLISLVVSAVLIGAGQQFAVMITQLSYNFSLYFLSLGGADHPMQLMSLSGNQALLASIINLTQVILSLIVWVIYQFRQLFLDVWIVFFPLAMAFYATDKTKGIAKMWWTEWIYQMCIPIGQSVVFGLASAVVSTPHGGLSIGDVFVALTGVVGLLGSATYVRKLIDLVAQGFGSSLMGHSAGEGIGHAMMLGGAGAVADRLGGMAVSGASKATSATAGGAVRSLDKAVFGGAAKNAVKNTPETHAGAIGPHTAV